MVSGIVCTYQYDLLDRATNIVYKAGSGSLIRGLEYEYNAASMIMKKKIVDDASCFVRHSYVYDSIDRLVSEEKSNSVSSAYSVVYNHDLAGNRLSETEGGLQTT